MGQSSEKVFKKVISWWRSPHPLTISVRSYTGNSSQVLKKKTRISIYWRRPSIWHRCNSYRCRSVCGFAICGTYMRTAHLCSYMSWTRSLLNFFIYGKNFRPNFLHVIYLYLLSMSGWVMKGSMRSFSISRQVWHLRICFNFNPFYLSWYRIRRILLVEPR